MKEEIKPLLIDINDSVLQALKRMDQLKRKLLIVIEGGCFKSLLSIGDIQRAIIANVKMTSKVGDILRPEVKVSHAGDDIERIKDYMRVRRNEFMPIIDDSRKVVDVIFWEELFSRQPGRKKVELNLPVVIMAGGIGSRLRPLTNVLPKPLIPIGNQTMVEDIMDRFEDCGCRRFFMSVNYKSEVIKLYFDSLSSKKYDISYFQETQPLGTAGSLHLLKDQIQSTFFVTNCDIIIDEDYSEILSYHRKSNNEITIVAAIKHISIPYGTLETCENGLLTAITEKPEYTYKINTGLYVLEPHLLDEIPQNRFYHITSLIEKLCNEGRQVGVFPINEGSWTDIGNWEEYMKIFNNR